MNLNLECKKRSNDQVTCRCRPPHCVVEMTDELRFSAGVSLLSCLLMKSSGESIPPPFPRQLIKSDSAAEEVDASSHSSYFSGGVGGGGSPQVQMYVNPNKPPDRWG